VCLTAEGQQAMRNFDEMTIIDAVIDRLSGASD
jgi:hypothetical protein